MQARAENSPGYRTPEVRDLAWAVFSTPLLDGGSLGAGPPLERSGFEINPLRKAWLADLDASPAPLLAALGDARSGRLGLYFECLWHFFLRADPAVELLAHNLPVRDGDKTLGEFDCIYYCRLRERPVHLELAVKFYLYHAPSPAGRRWLGPDSRDRLDLKLAHMLDHQLRLADSEAGRAALHDLGAGDPLREIEVKGRLFCRVEDRPRAPPGAGETFAPLRWLRLEEVAEFLDGKARYIPLARREWLAPLPAGTAPAVEGEALLAELEARLGDGGRPVQVAAMGPAGELARFFVVDEAWPCLGGGPLS